MIGQSECLFFHTPLPSACGNEQSDRTSSASVNFARMMDNLSPQHCELVMESCVHGVMQFLLARLTRTGLSLAPMSARTSFCEALHCIASMLCSFNLDLAVSSSRSLDDGVHMYAGGHFSGDAFFVAMNHCFDHCSGKLLSTCGLGRLVLVVTVNAELHAHRCVCERGGLTSRWPVALFPGEDPRVYQSSLV